MKCPECGHEFSPPVEGWKPKKICWECKNPIKIGHKWFLREDGRMQHRHCDNPSSYNPKETP